MLRTGVSAGQGPAIVVRAAEDASATARLLQAQGLEPLLIPLSRIEPVTFSPPDGAFDGVLLGSVNAVRFAGPALPIPAYAVGERTAEAARAAGWTVAWTGHGGMQAAIDALPLQRPLRLLRPTGAAPAGLTLPPQVTVVSVEAYRAIVLPMGETFPETGVVLLHAGEAARHLTTEIDRTGRKRAAFALACLAPRTAEAAGDGWRACEVAEAIDDQALVELAARLCHKSIQ